MPFDPDRLQKSERATRLRYESRIAVLKSGPIDVTQIQEAVDQAAQNIVDGERSFVIYGDPQSGKTEMMIALTAKLLDLKRRVIVVLVNDNVQLMKQNLKRFQDAQLHPAPQHFEQVLSDDSDLTLGEWVIFCKKNTHDLQKLKKKLNPIRDGVVVIDDEADYATPDGNVSSANKTKTKINELVGNLLDLGSKSIYVGVTATPARLNLNNTFNNQAERWVIFKPHQRYVGHQEFFPADYEKRKQDGGLAFRLNFLPDGSIDAAKHLKAAVFRFVVNVAHLNTAINERDREVNYCFLVHTSGNRVIHSADAGGVSRIFGILAGPKKSTYLRYYREIYELAEQLYPNEGDAIVQYILDNAGRYVPVIMNSDPKGKSGADYELATNPTSPFTVAFGGNIVSRGVTFNRLLGMFFTRDVKHKLQQDTYIQRARMFGDRGDYLEYFDLTIPTSLYAGWNRCFLFHNLALTAIQSSGKSPQWVEDSRVRPTASRSVDRATVNIVSGEMSFAKFAYREKSINSVCTSDTVDAKVRLARLQAIVGRKALPEYLTDFVAKMCPDGDASIAIHRTIDISKRKDTKINKDEIERGKGFIGTSQLQRAVFPKALHHFTVITNGRGKARVAYKYDNGRVRFLKSQGRPKK